MAYTNIDDPSAYFSATIYTGDGSADQSMTGAGFKPDFLWIKRRNASERHVLTNVAMGVSDGAYKWLDSADTHAEFSGGTGVASFDSDGFTIKSSDATWNTSGSTYVFWSWKANGGTTTSKSSATVSGNVTTPCVQQVNTTSGISILTYTASTSYAGTETHLEHGLGVGPKVLIVKRRDTTANWAVYHAENGGSPNAGYSYNLLNSTAATAQSSPTNKYWLNTPAESNATLLAFGSGDDTGADGGEYVCYAFAEKKGYSKFGSYFGNASADGPFVFTGFKPAWVLVKNSVHSGWDWAIMDNKRTPTNANGTYEWSWANLDAAEFTDGDSGINMEIDFLSNGFKIRTARDELNRNGDKFIYMCFAESPFVTSTGIPTTAR